MFFKTKIKWVKLFKSLEAAAMQLPEGKVQTIVVDNKKICVAHTIEGFFAMTDKCPHNGASLGNGYCTAQGSVVCPLHRYHFDLKTGRAKSGGGEYLQTYPIDIREDGVFIGFAASIWDL